MNRVEALVVLAIITAALFTGLDRVRFHIDESAWIGLSPTFEAFFTGRFRDPIWQERQDKLAVAPVTHYVIGAARRIGGFPPERLNPPWRWYVPYETNAAEGRVPEPRLLWWGRAGVTATAVGGIFVFFVLLLRAAGRPAAYAWLALALVNPYLRETLRRAMNEGVLLCFLALATWATTRALPHLDRPADAPGVRRRALAWLLAAAVAAGLAAQTKLSGALAVPGVVLVVMLVSIRTPARSSQRLRRAALTSALLAAVSFGTFIGANPTLWPDPARNTVRTVRERAAVMKDQVRRAGGPGELPTADRAGLVLTRVFSDFAVVPLKVAGPILFATGMTAAMAVLIGWMKCGNQKHALVSLVVVGAVVSLPMLGTPLDWSRYYLLPVFYAGLATSAGLAWLADRVRRSLSEARARR